MYKIQKWAKKRSKTKFKKKTLKKPRNLAKKMAGKKLVRSQNSIIWPKNTNHFTINVYTMIGFGFHKFFVQNEISRVFFPTYWILLTDHKYLKYLKNIQKLQNFLDFWPWLLKLGLIFDTRPQETLGYKIFYQKKMWKTSKLWIFIFFVVQGSNFHVIPI